MGWEHYGTLHILALTDKYHEQEESVEAQDIRRGDVLRLTFMGGTDECDVLEVVQFKNGKIGLAIGTTVNIIRDVVEPTQKVRRVKKGRGVKT